MNKLPLTSIQCACGAKINSRDELLIAKFDKLHGSVEHNLSIMEWKKLKQLNKLDNNIGSDLRL